MRLVWLGAAVLAACAGGAAALNPGPGTVDLYYWSSWSSVYLHYAANGGAWNPIPGDAMTKSTNTSFPAAQGWWQVEVAANNITWVLTNGQGQWDNNGGQNYVEGAPGIYALANGSVSTIAVFPRGCPSAGSPPAPCDGHGSCNAQTGTCSCDTGYWGPACVGVCPGAPSSICSGHGTCLGNGSCACTTGWATCSGGAACDTSVSSDPNNCGACGATCLPGPGTKSAVCAASKCTRVCDAGYTLCPDGQCHIGSECPLPGCETYSDNQCSGNVIITPANYTDRRWQTPVPSSPDYLPSFQSYAWLQGHISLTYSADHQSAVATFVPVTKDASAKVTVSFNGSAFSSTLTQSYAAPQTGPVSVTARIEGANPPVTLELEAFDFIWQHPDPNAALPAGADYRNGTKGGIVEMFGWPHAAIEQECAALAKAGWLGAKLFPLHEQLMSNQPFQNTLNPWYFMYQPVSYRLEGRMGTREELRDAIHTCRSLGVRLYADAVVNHMVGGGNGFGQHRNGNGGGCTTWGNKTTSRRDGPSPFYTQDFHFEPNANTGLPPSQEFPAVPYGPTDFHCERALNSWNSPLDLNAGWLTGLVDLNTEVPRVQQRIADYWTDLLSVGFTGFRVDAAKHIQPDDLAAIFGKFRANLGGQLPVDFVAYLEVLLGGEADMLLCNPDSGYNYAAYFEQALAKEGLSPSEIDSIKIWFSAYPSDPTEDCGQLSMTRKVIQNDDADQQNPGSSSRDMHGKGCVLVIDCTSPAEHRGFEEELFTSPPGASDNDNDYPIRLLLSSFYFDIALDPYGIPDGLSSCANCTVDCDTCTNDFPYHPAYNATAESYVGPVFTRTHRDLGIINAMRSWVHLPALPSASLLH